MRVWRFLATVVTTALLVVVTAVPVAARDQDRHDRDYLALGDSVAFGFNPLLPPNNAANFVGYPETLAGQVDLNVTNAACPGEASGGFISLTGVDNACRPYREAFPLHVAYTTAQLDFAVRFLNAHPHTRLVTLSLGGNDLLVLENQCGGIPACIVNRLPVLLGNLSMNLATIYTRLRVQGHYHHDLVALTYYARNFNDPVEVSVIQALNRTIARATIAADGEVADGFGAFKRVANTAGGDSCAAGLLIRTPAGPTPCDIHPTPLGRTVLASAIRHVLHDHEWPRHTAST